MIVKYHQALNDIIDLKAEVNTWRGDADFLKAKLDTSHLAYDKLSEALKYEQAKIKTIVNAGWGFLDYVEVFGAILATGFIAYFIGHNLVK